MSVEIRRRRSVAALAISLAMAAVACSPTPSASPSGDAASAPPSAGASSGSAATPEPSAGIAQATISTVAPVSTMDYTTAGYLSTPNRQAAQLGAGGNLYIYAQDGSIVPGLAADMPTFSEDGLTMTVKLRPGLTYSDGTPVTAEDAVAAFERSKASPNGTRLAAFDSAAVSGDGEITFTLNAPFSIETQGAVLVDWVTLHPRDRLSDPAYWEHPVSASQYVISDWTPGAPTMTLTANPTYWGGKPAIEKLVLSSAGDAPSRVLQVTTGAVDLAVDIPGTTVTSLPPEVQASIAPIGGVYWLGFNTKSDSPLKDVRVRQALCLAVDRDAINERAFQGNAEPASSVVSKYTPGWQATPVVPGGGARDVAAAKQLLADAGYAAGFEFPLQTWGNRPGWADAAQVITENLADVGVTAKIENIQDSVGIANLTNSTFDAMFTGGAGDLFTLLGTIYDPAAFWGKATGFDEPAVTELLTTLRQSAADPAAVQTTGEQILRTEWQNEASLCPLNERAMVVASRVPSDVLSVTPAANYFWVAPLQ